MRAPAARLTAVCDVPPPAGMAPEERAGRRCARPVASSSRFGARRRLAAAREGTPGGDGLGEAHQRDAERRRPELRARRDVGQGERRQARGMWPTSSTPEGLQAEQADAGDPGRHRDRAAPAAAGAKRSRLTRISDRGGRDGQRRRSRSRGRCCDDRARCLPEGAALSMWMPSSFGTWSSTITSPMPALNPVRTGSEMKLATKPRRSSAKPAGGSRRRAASASPTPRSSAAGSPLRHDLARAAAAGQDRDRRGRAHAERRAKCRAARRSPSGRRPCTGRLQPAVRRSSRRPSPWE